MKINSFTGNINIDDSKLIDKTGWFVSKIIAVTPYLNVGINQSFNIYCKILQPCTCHLKITIRKNQNQPITLFDQYIPDQVKDKQITISYTPNENEIYTVNYILTTNFNSYMNNWCKPIENYVEQAQSIIEVGGNYEQ